MACLKPAVELVVQQFLWPLRLVWPDGRLRSLLYIIPSRWSSFIPPSQAIAGWQDRLPGSLNPHKEPFQPMMHVNTSIRVNQFKSDPKKPPQVSCEEPHKFLQFVKILSFSFQLHRKPKKPVLQVAKLQ